MGTKQETPAGRQGQGKVDRLIEAGKSTRWQPGKSGNPSGARRDYVTHHLRELLDAPTAKKLAKTLLGMALKRNLPAIREVLDRADGKAVTRLAGAEGEPPIEICDRIPPGLTPEEQSDYVDKRVIELLSDWMARCGYELSVRKKKQPRRKAESLNDLLARQKGNESAAE